MRRMQVLTGMAIAALMTAGCTALPSASSNAMEEPPAYVNITRTDELKVQLIPQDDGAKAPNEHPAAFEPAQLQALLSSLRVRDKNGDALTIASPSRLAQLAADMSKGFVRAGPRQDVAFAVFRRSGGPVFSSSRRVTSGRAFYRDNTLNLVFGEFDEPFSEFRDLSVSPLKNGSRATASATSTAALVDSASWHRHGDRNDWIELPATSEAIESAAAAAPTVIESSTSSSAKPLQYGPAASAAASTPTPATASAPAAAQSASQPRPMPAITPSATAAVPEAAAGGAIGAAATARPDSGNDSDWSRIEDRLTQLKRLREKGLISEQDYQNKKDALLRELP